MGADSSKLFRIYQNLNGLWRTTGLRMAPRSEDRALTALLRALLTVRFFMSGVFLVNQRQRVPRGWWRANWAASSWESLPRRPEHALLVWLPQASIAPPDTCSRNPLTLVDRAPKAKRGGGRARSSGKVLSCSHPNSTTNCSAIRSRSASYSMPGKASLRFSRSRS